MGTRGRRCSGETSSPAPGRPDRAPPPAGAVSCGPALPTDERASRPIGRPKWREFCGGNRPMRSVERVTYDFPYARPRSANAAGSRPRAPQAAPRGRSPTDDHQPRRGNRPQPHPDAVRRGGTPRVTVPAFDELLRQLAAADVRFVLVGGLAVNAWGVVRGTKDVDVVVAPDEANFARLAEMAVAAG